MFDGGPGTDTVAPHYDTNNIAISLDGVMNDGETTELTDNIMSNVENITRSGFSFGAGNNGNDTLVGSADANLIQGQGGDDDITGLSGVDTLKGESGNDTVRAKDGEADTVDCGTGAGDLAYVDAGIDTVSNCESTQ